MSALAIVGVALVVAGTAVEVARTAAAARRVRGLNRAMHELRRPLQAVGLLVEAGAADPGAGKACMAQVRAGLAELDAIVNRRAAPARPARSPLGEVYGSLRERWRNLGVEFSAATDVEGTVADPRGLGAALDNLVANALEHGGGPISVRATAAGRSAEFEVRDAGAIAPRRSSRRDPRRGHGLRVVHDFTAAVGGSAGLQRGSLGGRATIRIPVEGPAPEVGTDRGSAVGGPGS